MNVTAADDVVRTHDEMAELLRYAIPGARIRLHPVASPGTPKGAQQARGYTIALDVIGRAPIERVSMYTLPCFAAPMRAHARRVADEALAAARHPDLSTRSAPDA